MSFITKRERVFNEYDIYDLPARNEGKLKAYASCTDARAWSHFCSDKSEHLVEIIKKNNEVCRPKYVPTDAIVNTLMAAKNAEIGRLKHKIEEFEQMLAAYDQLELTCDQKCEIANAHAAIKAANKELDEMCLDLDLSGFTEGMDSEAFETGKSRGDEASLHTAHEVQKTKPTEWEFEKEPVIDMPVKETKANQTTSAQGRDASTSAHDPRIDDLQDVIITKDAKLSAMQNTIAVMENDICEPYCIYAHIYTALEKIFAILCQNTKYKEYLDLLTTGKDTRDLDVKGKILFRLKILEKFSLALIALCTQESKQKDSQHECSCYHVKVETAYALTSPATRNLNLDSKRALLVADIMENQEIKEILSKDSISTKIDDDQIDGSFGVDSYSIETENLNRLKNLQKNFDDLLHCYENLKYEKNCLFIRCREYDELQKEFDKLRGRLQEYNLLWNEKEHYKKRSEDLDALKEKFLVLSEETSNIESKLQAETKINHMKCKAIDELRNENIALEKKLNDMSTSFEREKNILTCKLKEYECKIMCQEQQIKSLSTQIDELLNQDGIPSNIDATKTLELTDKIDSLKQQIKNLQNALICDEEEKQQLQEELRNKLELINDLKMEIEDWKSNHDRTVRSYSYEIQLLKEENRKLTKEIDEKSHENYRLIDELEHKKCLCIQLERITDNYDNNLSILENEKKNALLSLQLARTDSQKLIGNYEAPHNHQFQQDDATINNDISDENERCLMNIVDHDNEDSILLQEIQKLRADNITNLSKLQDENVQNKKSLELLKKESIVLKHKLRHLENLSQQFYNLKESNDSLLADKIRLETDLQIKTSELDSVRNITRRESETLITRLQQSENQKEQITNNYQDSVREKYSLLSDLSKKDEQLQILSKSLNELKIENDRLRQESQRVSNLERELRQLNDAYENLQDDFNEKTKDLESVYNTLQNKIEENRDLHSQIKNLQHHDVSNKNSLTTLQLEKTTIQSDLYILKTESAELTKKLQYYKGLENELNKLRLAYDQIKSDNNKMGEDIELQNQTNKSLQEQNKELYCHNQSLLSHIEELEKSQINTRDDILKTQETMHEISCLKKEVENMKLEKDLNHQKIKSLLDNLEESEQIIFKLNEDVLARDDKIAVLENHINQLQDEVKRLHNTLTDLTECSEGIKEYSLQNINESIKRMEAHHSKATHDMREDIVKLRNENNILENQLSATTLKSEESVRDIKRLHNERKVIANDIKQLEIKSTGNSVLLPSNCTVENILASISKISQSIDARHLKNTSLEKALLKVQSSFQLVVEKADKEKKSVDLEKVNLINEKDAALEDLRKMELNLKELKQTYEERISQDRCIINDLEAEILNQNLIIDKINKTKEDYISKLEKEIQSLQNMYETSSIKVTELQTMIHNVSEDNKRKIEIIEETNISLKNKSKEIESLKNTVHNMISRSVQSVSTQVDKTIQEINHTSKFTQTNEDYQPSDKATFVPISLEKVQELESNPNKGHLIFYKKSKELMTDILPKQEPYSLNEVQILRANIDMPSSDVNKRAHIDDKMKKLNFGPMEKCSIPSFNNSLDLSNEKFGEYQERNMYEYKSNDSFSNRHTTENSNTVDIYNVQSPFPASPTRSPPKKVLSTKDNNIKKSTIAARLSSTSLCNLKNENDEIIIKKDIKKHKSDKDLFLIYKDTGSNNTSPLNFKNELLEIYHKDQIEPSKETDKSSVSSPQTKKIKQHQNKSILLQINEDNDSIQANKKKPKLKINMPRIGIDSSSIITTSEIDNKSLDSYTYGIYRSVKRSTCSETDIDNPKDVSTIPLYGSPNTLDKLSHEEKLQNGLFRKSNDRNESDSNNKLRNNVRASLLRINSGQTSPPDSVINISNESELPKDDSHRRLSRVGANVLLIEYSDHTSTIDSINSRHPNGSPETLKTENFGLQYILDTIKCENDPDENSEAYKSLKHFKKTSKVKRHDKPSKSYNRVERDHISNSDMTRENLTSPQKSFIERGVLVKLDSIEDYENKIRHLSKTLENIEKDYKKKIDAVKIQYDSNIKNIINEHNQGVKSIQCLHEETLQDVIKIHENEVENLRTMSIEALRKVEKLEKENYCLKTKMLDSPSPAFYDVEPVKIPTPEVRKRRGRSRVDTKTLTKTDVEAFNVKPKTKSLGPCTCSVDMNISDTIRNIFEQVDADQRKVAENAYLKYIANKISSNNIEALDAQELSFLHLKVCRTWKTKLSKEEALQKRIDSLESELINKQRQAQQHMAELDRKVAEERRRLQEVREAVCRSSPEESRDCSPEPMHPQPQNVMCSCNSAYTPNVAARRSAGDLGPALPAVLKSKRTRIDSHKSTLTKMDTEERRDKKFYDDPPIRLKRSHDRPPSRKK